MRVANAVPPDLFVRADAARLVQILNNLLSNAAKFTPRGRISVGARAAANGWVEVSVSDTGAGIPRHQMASVFLPFEQADGSISREHGGFGLGLSIVQELVRAHGGAIWATSAVGRGSTFTFALPAWPDAGAPAPAPRAPPEPPRGAAVALPAAAERAAGAGTSSGGGEPAAASAAPPPRRQHSRALSEGAAAGAAGGASDAPPAIPPEFSDVPYDAAELAALASSRPFAAADAAAAAAAAAAGASAAAADALAGDGDAAAAADARPRYHEVHPRGRHQILSVDDDHVNQTVMQSLLGGAGYDVLLAGSGRGALEAVARARALPDLVLLDNMLPDMAGADVASKLRAAHARARLPVVMVSARVDEEAVVAALDGGAGARLAFSRRRRFVGAACS